LPCHSPEVAFLPTDFYSLNLFVAPKWGLYANLTAQIISQLSSHFIIHFHRRIVQSASTKAIIPDLVHTDTVPLDDEENDIVLLEKPPSRFSSRPLSLPIGKDRLCQQAFRRPHRGDSDKLVPRRIVSPLLVLLATCCCVLVVLGCALPSYSVSALGIVGVLVESGQKFTSADTSYSVLTTIKLLFDQASLTGTAADYIGLGTLSFILLISVLFAPVAQALVLLIQWFLPLTRKRRYRLMIALEIFQAWQYAEVYLLAIIVGSWQLGPISGM
jgi:Paraquat-inducible protein A